MQLQLATVLPVQRATSRECSWLHTEKMCIKWVSNDFQVNECVFSLLSLRYLKNILDIITGASTSLVELVNSWYFSLFFPFFFLLANKKKILVLNLGATGSLWYFYGIWKAISCLLQTSTLAAERGSHSHVTVMSETLQRSLRTSSFFCGSGMSLHPDEDEKFKTECKRVEWRFWKIQWEIWTETSFSPYMKCASHPVCSYTHTRTNTGTCIHKNTNKSQG